jgi:hypothetical protein
VNKKNQNTEVHTESLGKLKDINFTSSILNHSGAIIKPPYFFRSNREKLHIHVHCYIANPHFVSEGICMKLEGTKKI